eukprot:1582974-Ditylum_brightwellii.AAC.1
MNDSYIMPYAVLPDKFTPVKIKKLNYCRNYLGVTTVLDITLADGRTLDPHFRLGNKSLYSSKTNNYKQKNANQIRKPGRSGLNIYN